MEFNSKEDIEAPISQVFDVLTDLDALERQALRRGLTVKRKSDAPVPVKGMEWDAGFTFRGKDMSALIRLTEIASPERLAFSGRAGGLETAMKIDLTALSANRTRMSVTADLTPKTLSARLLVQSLKLAKGRVTRKFSVRLAQYAKTVEERAQRSA